MDLEYEKEVEEEEVVVEGQNIWLADKNNVN